MQAPIFPRGSFAANRRLFLYSSLFLSIMLFLSSCNNQPVKTASADQPDTTAAKPKGPTNKDIYAIFVSGDLTKLDSIVAKDCIDHNPWGMNSGLNSLKANITGARIAFPDMKMEALDEVVQGDMIYTHFRLTGTNTGPMEGHPATGKKIDVTGVDITRRKDGKLYEHWDYTDYITYFKQLGLDPLAPPAAKKTEKTK